MPLPEGYKSPINPGLRKRILEKAEHGEDMTTQEKAILMVVEIENAFSRDTKHFAKDGERELCSPAEVAEALLKDGEIILKPASGGTISDGDL